MIAARTGPARRSASPTRTGALILIALTGCHRGAAPEQEDEAAGPTPVACEPARAAERRVRILVRGVVATPPGRDVLLSSPIAGRLAEVRLHEGDRVEAGDLVAVVDDPSLSSALAEGDAASGAARASLENADRALARARRLVDQGIAPRRDVEDAEARRAAAAAELGGSEARRRLARKRRASARVIAPFDGVVVKLARRTGELVDGSAATPIAEIADPSRLELRADAPAVDLVRIPDGAAVAVRVDAVAGLALSGRVLVTSPAVDPATSLGSVRVALDPPPPGLHLKIGMAGVGTIDVPGSDQVVTIPVIAVRRSTEGSEEVVVCARDGEATRARVRPIEVGARFEDHVEVTSGLAAGEPVVVQHVLGLEDGAEIAPTAAAAPTDASQAAAEGAGTGARPGARP